jgi:uncharacterized protein (TIGR03435 family)
MKRSLAGVSLTLLLSGLLPGQSTTTAPVFEVADVHVSPSGTSQGDGGFMPGGRFELRGATMLDLITIAYGVEPEMVVGGPGWLNSDRFDVIAKAPSAKASEETLRAMLKALLVDRFKLVAREDKRDMPVFVLTVGKTAGKKGLKLQTAAKPGEPSTSRGEGDPGLNHRLCKSFTMADLAELLPQVANNFVNHPVVDETNLKGSYDFQLDWMGMGPYRKAKANPDGPTPVSAFDAVEKLGLHLEEQKRPMPVIVVEQANQTPTPNPEGVTAKIPTFPTEFDVAEVRPAKPGVVLPGQPAPAGPMGRMMFQNGRIEIMGATLKGLLTLAFDVRENAIVGGPKWLDEDRFDIIAKAPANLPEGAILGMLKALIVERFKLTFHNEDQPMPVYVLEAGKKPRIKEADATARSECKIVNTDKRNYVCRNTTMAQFAERLPTVSAAYIHPPLLDLTGIQGAYDFDLYWTPKGQLSDTTGSASEASTPVNEVTVFEAVDKQLGLKLEEQKHPIPVVVIDHVDRTPSEK